MTVAHDVTVEVNSPDDIVVARYAGYQLASYLGFLMIDVTMIATAISELARNITSYATRGTITIWTGRRDARDALIVRAEDNGPGIADIEKAMQDGYSTGGGLGLGLPGARRMMDGLTVESELGHGTIVEMWKWLPEAPRTGRHMPPIGRSVPGSGPIGEVPHVGDVSIGPAAPEPPDTEPRSPPASESLSRPDPQPLELQPELPPLAVPTLIGDDQKMSVTSQKMSVTSHRLQSTAQITYWMKTLWMLVFGTVLLAVPDRFFGPTWLRVHHYGTEPALGCACLVLACGLVFAILHRRTMLMSLLLLASGLIMWTLGWEVLETGVNTHSGGLMEAMLMWYIGLHMLVHSASLARAS
jgi:serine/threonine-protein kinase RsbT